MYIALSGDNDMKRCEAQKWMNGRNHNPVTSNQSCFKSNKVKETKLKSHSLLLLLHLFLLLIQKSLLLSFKARTLLLLFRSLLLLLLFLLLLPISHRTSYKCDNGDNDNNNKFNDIYCIYKFTYLFCILSFLPLFLALLLLLLLLLNSLSVNHFSLFLPSSISPDYPSSSNPLPFPSQHPTPNSLPPSIPLIHIQYLNKILKDLVSPSSIHPSSIYIPFLPQWIWVVSDAPASSELAWAGYEYPCAS